ncbi:3'-5' exonuclease [Oscillatoria sp. FACHB-1406]|uniref:3'-5' exonuclease n=1 Tax=Oscillatoria sp. FACHB-1406 TaxID=2692846 RepID=UPI001682AD9F|nr:3'-5' exonuclease [Oscillatoria sp. FACHB-1406]MBD2580309.1 hypothetical protein [Oscillatoria sp. FACHB-1406]
MYVYRSRTFEEQLSKQSSLGEHFENFCRELEEMTLDRAFSRFQRLYPYLKRKEGNLRLIARVQRVGDEQVLCWLTVFRRGDRDYEIFLRDRALKSPLDERDLQDWLKAQKAKPSKLQTVSTPPLDESLRPWLERPDWIIDRKGSLVCESQEWIERFATAEIQEHWETYYRAISTLVDNTVASGKETAYRDVYLYDCDGCFILYRKITTLDRPPRQVLFLLAPFTEAPCENAIDRVLASICGDNSPHGDKTCLPLTLTLEELTPIAYRAYPSYFLADEDRWRLLQSEQEINLALSSEEEAILHAVSTAQPSLPLFLNGQAGSGKSTLLFHLFADYCNRHFDYASAGERDYFAAPHPLFLAYSDRLLEVAKKRVTALLGTHHRFLERRAHLDALPNLSPFFRTFRPFLRDLLPPQERDRFLRANYISFHRFRQLLNSKTGVRSSPERCWQAIRTFIKGYHFDEREAYLELEDYAEIPKKERTISEAEFKSIYQSAWPWYKDYCQKRNLWDDQDLIRTVLKLKCYRPDYTAIFCDEAQDFTPLELRLIMRLSAFSQYDLERQYVQCLPFVFAGDPLQTLNPTGFRWESLKAAFYNEAIAALSPTGQLNLEMNFTELEYNYRSIPAIVGVNNLIQLWRSVLFDLPDIQPQQSRKLGIFKPQKLILGVNLTAETLKYTLPDAIIIIPCDEGGEIDYARRDEILCELLTEAQGDRCPWNVLSATAAKGLEFKQVILYKFGEACPPHLWERNEQTIEAQKYFLNKLYVATSRATERLFIIDTETGDNQLWRWASDEACIDTFLQRKPVKKNRDRWHGKLHPISLSDGLELLKTDDFPTIAQTFLEQGLETKNPELLRRAQGAYLRLKEEKLAALCEAFALEFEGNFFEAGWQFVKQGELQQAWICFWSGMYWRDALAIEEQFGKNAAFIPDKFQLAVARFLAHPQANFQSLKHFSLFLEGEAKQREERHFSPQWQAAIASFIRQIKALIHQPEARSIPIEQWQSWGELLDRLTAEKEGSEREIVGDCFYLAKDYDRALKAWEAAKTTQKLEYHLIKAKILGLNDGLNYLLSAQQHDAILMLWQRKNRPRAVEWMRAIAPALKIKERYFEALVAYSDLDDLAAVKSCFDRAFPRKQQKVLKYYLNYTLQQQHWEEATAAIEKYLPVLLSPEADAIGLKYWLVAAIARSPLTSNRLDRDRRQLLARFIVRHILTDNWTQHLSMQHVGIALEKIGSLIETLEFYERYLKTSPIARQRWLATKTRQAAHFRKLGHLARVERIEVEIRAKSQQWGINCDLLPLTLPIASVREVKARTAPTISGLPPDFPITWEGTKICRFQWQHLKIEISLQTQQVSIVDTRSEQYLRLDIPLQQISLGAMAIRSQGGERLNFQDLKGGYKGVVLYNGSAPRLMLRVRGLEKAIAIAFS